MRIPASVELGNRITAQQAAQRFGLGRWGYAKLIPAIDAGIVRGERIEVGRRCIRLVDPDELAEDLANLPPCGHVDKQTGRRCDKPALGASGGCSGAHARAIETRGRKLSAETRHRMSEGKKGKPRPDVRERVAAMHASPKDRASWGLATMEGRARGRRTIAKRSDAISPNTWRRWKGRLAGVLAGRQGGKQRGYTDKHIALARKLKMRDARIGRTRISRLLGVTEDQARAILIELEG